MPSQFMTMQQQTLVTRHRSYWGRAEIRFCFLTCVSNNVISYLHDLQVISDTFCQQKPTSEQSTLEFKHYLFTKPNHCTPSNQYYQAR